jgi:hypothetical protein
MNLCGVCGEGVNDELGYITLAMKIERERYVGSKYHVACFAEVDVTATLIKLRLA